MKGPCSAGTSPTTVSHPPHTAIFPAAFRTSVAVPRVEIATAVDKSTGTTDRATPELLSVPSRMSAPQHTTEPSVEIAALCSAPAAICVIGPAPSGTRLWPKCWPDPVFVTPAPQHTTVPSDRRAILCHVLHATAITDDKPAGICVCPCVLLPHAATVPSALTTTVCSPPPLACSTLPTDAGTVHCPAAFQPQHARLPSRRSAMV